MASSEGFLGVRLAGKRIMLFGSLAAVLVWLAIGLTRGHFETLAAGWRELVVYLLVPLVLGSVVWIFGWLLRGNNRTRRSGVNPNIW